MSDGTDERAKAGETDAEPEVETDHLDDLADGCGCAEVWEHLSERRGAEATDD